MRRSLPLILFTTACGAASSAVEAPPSSTEAPVEPVRLSLELRPGTILAYRVERRGEDWVSRSSLFLVVNERGELIIEDLTSEGESFRRTAPAERIMEDLFPTLERPLGAEARRRTRGNAQETFFLGDRTPREVRITVERRFPPETGQMLLLQGRYNPEARRYDQIVITEVYERDEGSSHGQEATSTYDEEMAEARRDLQRAIENAGRRAKEELEEYLAAHGVEEELSEAFDLFRSDELGGMFLLKFHYHGNRRRFIRRLLEPENSALAATILEGILPEGERLFDDETLSLLRARAEEGDMNMTLFLAGIPDERLTPLLERLALHEDRRIVHEARSTLEVLRLLEHPQAPQVLRYYARNDEGIEAMRPLLLHWSDRVGLAGVLVGLLEERFASAPSCTTWLREISLRDYTTVEEWRAFWESHGERSYFDWVLEAAGDPSARQEEALQLLGRARGAPAERAREVLSRALESDSLQLRYTAASALASLGDDAGVPVLLEMLRRGCRTQQMAALVALARLQPTTLGYRPGGTEIERAVAAARWEAWAERRD